MAVNTKNSIFKRWFRGILRNKKASIGLTLIIVFIFISTVGPFFVQDPLEFLGTPLSPPSFDHFLGTNGQGQDVLSQTVCGARQTLLIGFTTGILVVFIGALIGGCSGYYGGKIDDALSLLINIFLVMPGLPLMVILASWLPPGPGTLIGVLVLTGWAWNARVIRSQMMTYRNRDFVSAAIVSGESNIRIIVVEIMPRMLSLLASSFIGASIYAIGAQVGLEFLGLGDVSNVTWGTNLYWASNDMALLTGSWWTFIPTGLSIALVSFALTLINFGIDEATNPRLISERYWRKEVPIESIEIGITPVIKTNE
jgi:peptide/nickel transport system permease protein